MIVTGNTTELFVIDQLFDIGIRSADAAMGILLQFHEVERHIQRVVQQQLADQRLADTKQDLQRFGGLQRANGARQHAQYSTLGTRWDESRWRRLREETSIARAFFGIKHAHLPIKTIDGGIHIRLAEEDGYI